jgi:DNA-binding transcriptional ArsR family regulator
MSKTIPPETVFISAAELFSVLSTPLRLQIISALCSGEKNVTQLRDEVQTTQPNMSQHLSMLYRAGIVARRREGNQIYYRIQSERAATLCRAVCTQLAIELEPEANIPASDRLMPAGVRG